MPGIKLYIGNLPDRCEESSLRDLFSPYGQISDLVVIKNYAFVHFDAEEDANKAVEDLHKTKLLGNELTVEVSKNKQPQNGGRRNERKSYSDNKRPRNLGGHGMMPPGMPQAGGILGMGPNMPPAALGLLSAVNAVNTVKNAVAAAAQAAQRQSDVVEQRASFSNSYDSAQHNINHMPNPSLGSRDLPPSQNMSDGYVIYERFYVDHSHPLLKGLPVPEIPRITDGPVTQDIYQKKDSYITAPRDLPLQNDPYTSRREEPYNTRQAEQFPPRCDEPYPARREEPSPYPPRRDESYQAPRRDDYGAYRERSPLHSRREYDRADIRDSRPLGYGDYTDRR